MACYVGADSVAVYLAFLVGYKVYREFPVGHRMFLPHWPYVGVAFLGTALVLGIFRLNELYALRGSILHIRELETILRSVTYAVVGFWAVSYAVQLYIPRILVLIIASLIVAATTVERLIVGSVLRHTFARVQTGSRVLVLGCGQTAQRLFRKMAQSPQHGMRVVGFLTAQPSPVGTRIFAPSYSARRESAEVMGSLRDLEELAQGRRLFDALVITEELTATQVEEVQRVGAACGLAIHIAPPTYGFFSHWIEYADVDGIPLGHCRPPAVRSLLYRASKRLFDLAFSAIVLLLASPLFLLVAALIRLDTPGPVLFGQERIGQQGRAFRIWKFRSMRVDAVPYAASPHSNRDPRLTRVGRWLRRLSLDELPQLCNVLRGEMSLVGPRPEMPFIVASYGPLERERLRVKPGLTGLWQISADRALAIHENLEYDLYYIEKQSFFLDLVILMNTALFLVRGVGAW